MSTALDDAWTGRNDGDTPEHRRWHQHIRPADGTRGDVALVGFASEEGVRRNGGRPGAAEGPDALRRALAPLAIHTEAKLHDAGTVTVNGDDLETGHDALGNLIAE
ncbi:MAG: arginase family protein, partial [Mobilicoccus sp.]|nr:arginase family protein [Mobilicoccus sp.]